MTLLWRTTYRGHDDKAVNTDHPTERDAEVHATSLVQRLVVPRPELVYIYPIELEESA